jgi:hypothetical protein
MSHDVFIDKRDNMWFHTTDRTIHNSDRVKWKIDLLLITMRVALHLYLSVMKRGLITVKREE